jgi:hypothetical protein
MSGVGGGKRYGAHTSKVARPFGGVAVAIIDIAPYSSRISETAQLARPDDR